MTALNRGFCDLAVTGYAFYQDHYYFKSILSSTSQKSKVAK